jgi:hypothetical protein
LPLPRRRPRGSGTPVLISDRARRPLGKSPGDPAEGDGAQDTAAAGSAEPPAAGHPAEDPGTPPRPVAPVPPPAAVPATEQGEPEAAADGPGSVLPRRVRQASLAPQLRGEAPRPGAGDTGRESTPERSAEEVRSRMASIQRGWQRGRRAAEAAPAEGPAPAPEAGAAPGDGLAPPAGGGAAAPDAADAPAQVTRTTGTTPEGNGR